MNSIEKLTQIFSHFPGIGPRQARRFVYYLLTRNKNVLDEFSEHIKDLKNDVIICEDCFRFFENSKGSLRKCKVCSNDERDHSVLMVVQRDIDLESVEKNGVFNGVYFVLGGSVPILEKEPEKRIRIRELKKYIEKLNPPTQNASTRLREIILGMNWNPEGENTANFVEKFLKPTTEKNNIKISKLGKGLSMGAELEYTDPDTLKNALKNRG